MIILDEILGYLCLRFMHENWRYREENEEANERIMKVMMMQEQEEEEKQEQKLEEAMTRGGSEYKDEVRLELFELDRKPMTG
jgi:DNA replication protein DnaC